MDFSTEKSQAVEAAKSFIINNGSILSLPIQQGNASTRSMSYSTDATPVWEQATIECYHNKQLVIVPLQSKDEIRSRALFINGDEQNYQFSKTFSRLIVSTKDNLTSAYILTYLPESKYAETNSSALATMGYGVGEAKFHGIIIVSLLNGEILRTLMYEEGALCRVLIPAKEHTHTDACTHENVEVGNKLSIYLYSVDTVTRDGTYGDGYELPYCKYCGNLWAHCLCESYICQKCGQQICDCNVVEFCPTCGEWSCICFLDPDYCYVCKTVPCSFGGH